MWFHCITRWLVQEAATIIITSYNSQNADMTYEMS